MQRWFGWTAAVAVIAGLWVVFGFAPQLQQWIALVWAIGLPVSGIVAWVLAWRRRKRVAETLRPYGPDFITLQDDFLGRPHTAGAAWTDDRPVPTLVEHPHADSRPAPERRSETGAPDVGL